MAAVLLSSPGDAPCTVGCGYKRGKNRAHLASPGTPTGNCSPALSSPPPPPAPLTTPHCPCENQTGSLGSSCAGSGQGEWLSPGGGHLGFCRGWVAGGLGFLEALRGAEGRAPRAGQLPCIVAEDARRIAQEPVPELPSFPILGLRHAFRGGGRHDTGDGSVCFQKI